jgi:hypothetical protein
MYVDMNMGKTEEMGEERKRGREGREGQGAGRDSFLRNFNFF